MPAGVLPWYRETSIPGAEMQMTWKYAPIVLAACIPTMAPAGPLTDILVDSVSNHGAITWEEGYDEGGVEVLDEVVLRLHDGRRIDIESLELDRDGRQLSLLARNVRQNPDGTILLLSAERIAFTGARAHLDAMWAPDSLANACVLAGSSATVKIEDIGFMVAAPEGSLDDDSRVRIAGFSGGQVVRGNLDSCSVQTDVTIEDYSARLGDGSSSEAGSFVVSTLFPGSISSVAADPDQPVSVTARIEDASSLIYGGATAWAIDKGSAQAKFTAMSLVPALTEMLRERGQDWSAPRLMRLWNSLRSAEGALAYDIDSMTVRSANVLPPGSVRRIAEAGLTTVLLSGEGGGSVSDGDLDLDLGLQATGLIRSRLVADLDMRSYPEGAILSAAEGRAFVNMIPPVGVSSIVYEQTDDGFTEAFASIRGLPVSVAISQQREKRSKMNSQAAAVIRQVATDIATFITISERRPPARLSLSVIDQLDLREAFIVSSRAPGEISTIFDYSIDSAAQ